MNLFHAAIFSSNLTDRQAKRASREATLWASVLKGNGGPHEIKKKSLTSAGVESLSTAISHDQDGG